MPVDPSEYIGEILGEPASLMPNPVNAEYRCPFINSECTKRSHLVDGPYPVCSIWHWQGRGKARHAADLICVCPNRLYQAPIIDDIMANCWPGEPSNDIRMAYEVKMSNLGKVDAVLADFDDDENVRQFVSVEFQTVDITGSYFPAYISLINAEQLDAPPKYNFNWRNVYKRYIMQLIFKGFYHHHWNTRLVAVMQDKLVDRLWETGNFQESPIDQSNIVFLSYSMVPNEDKPGYYHLVLDRPIGTRHMDLMQGILYQQAPSRESFIQKIIERL